ncbi:MAG: septum formation protein Maf [Alphaproteobacteria bacterium]|nr:septum formation protein Maf [Alphaproteobacteria bacterium]
MTKNFILASQSPQRKALLEQIDFAPELIEPADIDETPRKGEKPSQYVKRMALEKALSVASRHPEAIVLASDTVIVLGSRIIQKAHSDDEQKNTMQMLSGKSHRVLTGVCVVNRAKHAAVKLNINKVKMKRLSATEINDYVASREWCGCAGYKIEGLMGGFVEKINGSYSGIVGLPLCEARNLLIGAGVK